MFKLAHIAIRGQLRASVYISVRLVNDLVHKVSTRWRLNWFGYWPLDAGLNGALHLLGPATVGNGDGAYRNTVMVV